MRLREACPNIVGVKDATANMERASLQRGKLGKDFIQLSGEDMHRARLQRPWRAGCISVTSNVAPRLCAEFQAAMPAGRFRQGARPSRTSWRRCTRRCSSSRTRPGVKYVAERLGMCANELRLPMVPVSAGDRGGDRCGAGPCRARLISACMAKDDKPKMR